MTHNKNSKLPKILKKEMNHDMVLVRSIMGTDVFFDKKRKKEFFFDFNKKKTIYLK